MSATVGHTDMNAKAIEAAEKLCKTGKEITELLKKNPKAAMDKDSQCLKVFAEVSQAVGVLLKGRDGGEKLFQRLESLTSYTSLLPYFLLMKGIVDRVKDAIQIDNAEHKERLQWINGELVRIAAQATDIAKQLEDFGNSLIHIIVSDEPKQKASLMVFDILYDRMSTRIIGCISDLAAVKCMIDQGFQSVAAFKKRIMYTAVGVGFFGLAAMIIAPLAVGFLALIPAYGIFDIIGVAAIAGGAVGGIAAYPIWKYSKEANKIVERYNDQQYNWKALDQKLQDMKKELERLYSKRTAV